ncbi:nucleoside triphosphate pyrophosphohydrolase [uncultured Gemmiger sp.]|uniref:nucleoside triphosphate pyrophosphohydrolase n=1 Tax=uncultured Gemmiger sp. TaxID=1623490 RepID=UPI0025FDE3D8|nr:nucleoside triphosphate pyrophosphohydrolase [uncultured Gemmiger sp.]
MNAYPEKQQYTADDLAAIIAILRDPENGCPWDKVQNHTSIRMNFLEEAYEAVDAIDLDDPELMCEELGDVLMQVVFHAQIEREAGHFTFAEVCDGVCRKLIERHPHIFGGDESIKDWDSLKNKEKGRLTLADELESVPKALPALMRAAKLQKRAARYGVETPADAAAVAKAAGTVEMARDKAAAEQAMGELLFAAAALARKAGLDPEQALQKCNAAFTAENTQTQES